MVAYRTKLDAERTSLITTLMDSEEVNVHRFAGKHPKRRVHRWLSAKVEAEATRRCLPLGLSVLMNILTLKLISQPLHKDAFTCARSKGRNADELVVDNKSTQPNGFCLQSCAASLMWPLEDCCFPED